MANKTLEQLKRDIALQHPLNSYPTMLGAIGGAFYFLIEPIMVVGIAGATLATIGIGSLIVNGFIRRDAFALEAMQKINAKLERDRIKNMGILSSKLDSELTRQQLERIQDKFSTFRDVLNERFQKGTITYNRFLSTAQEIFKLSVKRIEEIHLKEKQIAGIDCKGAEKRLRQLNKEDESDPTVVSEKASLQSRIDIKGKNEQRIKEILASNEQAITKFDIVMDQMSENECSEQELSFLMEELESVSKAIHNIE